MSKPETSVRKSQLRQTTVVPLGRKPLEGVELSKYLDSCWPLLAPQPHSPIRAPGPTVLHYLDSVSEHRMLHIQGSS